MNWNGSGQIQDSDIAFNGFDFTFNTNGTKQDIGSICCHELGHSSGNQHSALRAATMYPIASNFDPTSQQILTRDDMVGLAHRYPGSGFSSTGTIQGTLKKTNGANIHSGSNSHARSPDNR